VAIFWTEHTARQWNRNIRLQAGREAVDDLQTARLLAIANAAMADAWIACWDAKYYYSFWRPVTAIQQGDSDGRRATIRDPHWMPFRTTPNHPEYPGAHACVSTAASDALKRFFHRDRTNFPMDANIGTVIYVHTFTRYTDAGAEARAARIFGGMHYQFSNEAGARIGRQVVRWLFANGFFRPIDDSDVVANNANRGTSMRPVSGLRRFALYAIVSSALEIHWARTSSSQTSWFVILGGLLLDAWRPPEPPAGRTSFPRRTE